MDELKSPHQTRVEEFMRSAGQDIPAKPVVPGRAVRISRARLLMEELMETLDALGVRIYMSHQHLVPIPLDFDSMTFCADGLPNIIKVADGLADISVVNTGTMSSLGISDIPLLELVDANNLAKFGPGGRKCETTGKWLKPPNHKPPDIRGCLLNLGADPATLPPYP